MIKGIITRFVTFLLFTKTLCAQCPSSDSSWKDISGIINADLPKPDKLQKLKNYQERLKACRHTNDSSYMLLLRNIGWAHSDLSDFENAAGYFQESVNIIKANPGSHAIRFKDLINSYYYLFEAYDLLNNVPGKLKAADDCIDISYRLNDPSNPSCIRCWYAKVEHAMDIGDYYSCIENAKMCQKLPAEYLKSDAPPDYKKNILDLEYSCIGWHVNALLSVQEYADARMFLTGKVGEYKRDNLKNYLGLTYSELAEVQEKTGHYDSAIYFANLSFLCYRDLKDNYSSKQILNDIGESIYFRHLKNYDKALTSYRQALQYKNNNKEYKLEDSSETLKILGNIANIYVQKRMFDSAFNYFQYAFNQVKYGINETGVILKNSPEEFIAYKKMPFLVSLVINKGDAYLEKYKSTQKTAELEDALRIYKLADIFFDKIRTEQSDIKSKLFWRKESRRLYEHAITACHSLVDTSFAFYFFEKSRAVLLNDH